MSRLKIILMQVSARVAYYYWQNIAEELAALNSSRVGADFMRPLEEVLR